MSVWTTLRDYPAPDPVLASSPLAAILCVELLSHEALAKQVERGWKLATSGTVSGLRNDSGTLRGLVKGSRGYTTSLDFTAGTLGGKCSCPDWKDRASKRATRTWCKHQVALGFAVLGYTSPAVPANPITPELVAALSHSDLCNIVLASAQDHSASDGALTLALVRTGLLPAPDAVRHLITRVSYLGRYADFAQESSQLGYELASVIEAASVALTANPDCVTILGSVVDEIQDALSQNYFDDSSGSLGEAAGDALTAYVAAVDRSGGDLDSAANDLARWLSHDDYGSFYENGLGEAVALVGPDRLSQSFSALAIAPDPPRPVAPLARGAWETWCKEDQAHRDQAATLNVEVKNRN
jgi:hypothetical protein